MNCPCQIGRAAPDRAADPLGRRRAVRPHDDQRVGIGDDAVEPAQGVRVGIDAPAQPIGGERRRIGGDASRRRHVLGRGRAHFASVDENHHPIGKDRSERRESCVALGRRQSSDDARRRRLQIGKVDDKGLEPQQQPFRIVGDLEHERSVARERQRHFGPLQIVRAERPRQRQRRQTRITRRASFGHSAIIATRII